MKRHLALLVTAACANTPTAGSDAPVPLDPFLPETLRVVVTEHGGLTPTPAPGSTCTVSDNTFTLDVATRTLAWRVCGASPGSFVYTFGTGQKALTDADFTALSDALHALQLPASPCASDFHATVAFATPTGTATHGDAECWTGWDAVDNELYTIVPG